MSINFLCDLFRFPWHTGGMKCLLLSVFIVMLTVPAWAQQGAVVSAHPLATQAGQRVLAEGGNAFDAAVAVSAMLSVVEPAGSGLGGGGFWLLYDADKDDYTMLDARETAPMASHADMYLDSEGVAQQSASREGPRAAGIPGMAAVLDVVINRYGRQSLQRVLAPAIQAARDGFAIEERYQQGVTYKRDLMLRYTEAGAIFLDQGQVPAVGWVLKQPDLARTLQLIAKEGAQGFYTGAFAKRLVQSVRDNGGIWTEADLANYEVIERKPEMFSYHDARIVAASLPSSGGLVLRQALGILEGFDLNAYGLITRTHLIVESLRRAYHDRAAYMGDPEFLDHPVPQPDIAALQAEISFSKASKSSDLNDVLNKMNEGTETTHFAVVDEDGNRVAVTQSINFWFGSGFVPAGTGMLLNNEMDDFSVQAGVENGYQLIGGQANAIKPGKRMLSSMTPVFVEQGGSYAIIGTPGGSRIISMNLLAILDWLDGKTADAIVAAKRFHHQFHPDEIVYETDAFDSDTLMGLSAIGHALKESSRPYGNMQIITYDHKGHKTMTASDPRGIGGGARVY